LSDLCHFVRAVVYCGATEQSCLNRDERGSIEHLVRLGEAAGLD